MDKIIDVKRLSYISVKIQKSAKNFRTFHENVGISIYLELADDFEYLCKVFIQLKLEVSFFLDLIEMANNKLEYRDYVGLADTLSYEIDPILDELIKFFEEK